VQQPVIYKETPINRAKLDNKIRVVNADGTENKAGRITHHNQNENENGRETLGGHGFGITELEGHDIFLGY